MQERNAVISRNFLNRRSIRRAPIRIVACLTAAFTATLIGATHAAPVDPGHDDKSAVAAPGGAPGVEPAAVVFPDTPAGRCAAAFVASFNAGDEASIRAFEQRYRAAAALKERPIETRLAMAKKLKSQWGTLRPLEITQDEPAELTLAAATSNRGETLEMTFELEPAPPHGLTGIRIAQMHGGGVDPAARTPLDAAARKSAIDDVCRLLKEVYVFPDVAEKMAAAVREKADAGAYDAITRPGEFAERLMADLQAVSRDKHLQMRPGAMGEPPPSADAERHHAPIGNEQPNFGFRRVEVLPGNIGYVQFDSFDPRPEAMETASAAMAFVSRCDALIFDVRENGGGAPEMIAHLSGYLFEKPTVLNRFIDRAGNVTGETRTPERPAGRRFGADVPVFVLTSGRTFSAAEEFTYNLQQFGRATIVGERTGGGAHPVQPHSVAGRFMFLIPFQRAENAVSKKNWEGTGVTPDIACSAEEALERACRDAESRSGAPRTVIRHRGS